MTASKGGIHLRFEYLDALRDYPAALLMSQIAYWNAPSRNTGHSKLRVFKKGRWWLVKSHRDWWDECRLSRRQVDRALTLLEKEGYIEVMIARFNNLPTRHIGLLRLHLQVQSECTHRCKQFAPTGATINREYKQRLQTETNQGARAKPKTDMNADDVLKKLDAKHKPMEGYPETLVVKKASHLSVWWSRLLPFYHDVGYVKPPTFKEVGILGQYLKVVGEEQAYAVMHWAIRNWGEFSIYVREEKAATCPKYPTIGALRQHWDVAQRHAVPSKKQLTASTASAALSGNAGVHKVSKGKAVHGGKDGSG